MTSPDSSTPGERVGLTCSGSGATPRTSGRPSSSARGGVAPWLLDRRRLGLPRCPGASLASARSTRGGIVTDARAPAPRRGGHRSPAPRPARENNSPPILLQSAASLKRARAVGAEVGVQHVGSTGGHPSRLSGIGRRPSGSQERVRTTRRRIVGSQRIRELHNSRAPEGSLRAHASALIGHRQGPRLNRSAAARRSTPVCNPVEWRAVASKISRPLDLDSSNRCAISSS